EIVDGAGEVRHRLRPRDFRVVFLGDAAPVGGVGDAGDQDAGDGTPAAGAAAAGWSVRASARFEPTATGTHRFKLKTNGEARLLVDGQPVDEAVDLEAGRPVELLVEASTPDPGLRLAVELRCA